MIEFSSTCPQECPVMPLPEGKSPVPCSMMEVRTGSQKIRFVLQCTRCGYLDPAVLDRWAESAAKESLSASEARTAMAISGEPFTFVRSSDADITLYDAIGQALGAASMCWENPAGAGVFDSSRAAEIYTALYKIINEKRPAQ